MLKLIYLPVIVSTLINSLLFFFPSAGYAQDYPLCFVVFSSGQLVNLENLCIKKQKADVCQGAFDSGGLPVAFSTELEQLKRNLKQVQQENPDFNTGESLQIFFDRLVFSNSIQALLQQRKILNRQFQQASNQQEKIEIAYKSQKIDKELNADPCYSRIMNALFNTIQNY